MKSLKKIAIILGGLLLLSLCLLGYFTIRDYNPDRKEIVVKDKAESFPSDTVSCVIWNIGYCGLSEDMSFFYDGGEQTRTTKEQTEENLAFIKDQLASENEPHFFLLQEVDTASKRSYFINEFDAISKTLDNYYGSFATNYQVDYVPVPVSEPLGKVRGGLATFARYNPEKAVRYAFPGSYSWPMKLFMLDRCFLTTEYPLKNGRKLIVVNTHNSAYDDGSLKRKEMNFLKKYLIKEYTKGNYLIVGGDWNQSPPGIDHAKERFDLSHTMPVKKDFLPEGWKWGADYQTPTNRSLQAPLNKESKRRILDFYLVSPNVKILNVKTRNHHFKHTDHHPVFARFKLIN
jgi:endonuclease/exonuclease/phosphatase family metal-dependent hydrolase